MADAGRRLRKTARRGHGTSRLIWNTAPSSDAVASCMALDSSGNAGQFTDSVGTLSIQSSPLAVIYVSVRRDLEWLDARLPPRLERFVLYLVRLPMLCPTTATAEAIVELHQASELALLVMIGLHVGAAFAHAVIRRDGVMQRMLP